MEAKLRLALARAEEVARELSDPSLAKDQARLSALGREHSRLAPIVRLGKQYLQLADERAQAKELIGADDPELSALAFADADRLQGELARLEVQLEDLLAPPDPREDRSAILEIRAGTGGDEAALFARDIYRMYVKYAESKRLRVEEMLTDSGGHTMLERRFLELVREAGLPRPRTQVVFRDGNRHVARVDFLFDGLGVVVEVSGQKGHSAPSDRLRDAQRRNELQDLGYRVFEYTYDEVVKHPAVVRNTLRLRLRPPTHPPTAA